jgi:glutamate-ammonia-ligase adenylyltransferase
VLSGIERWPRPADLERARLGLERWRERAAGAPGAAADFAAEAARDAGGRAMLEAVFGNSPYLTESLIAEQGFLAELAAEGLAGRFDRLLAEAESSLAEERDTLRLMGGLRRTRRRAALAVALADIGGAWDLEAVMGALTRHADVALRLAVRHLLRRAAERGAIALADEGDPGRESGLIVLAMGKLGGRELNFSSDIDLIILYDDAVVRTTRPDEMARTFIRLARDLVRIMEERTADGYVFRTDLRLRPDPGATPLAVSVSAAEGYYGSLAQNWERAAMIKARPVAGDLEAGRDFVRFLQPFVWRRSLDFGAIEDIHAIKRQINAHRGLGRIAVEGHDIKLGRGGIREIEFFAQTQQLVFGGREPRLRVPATTLALARLAEAGRIDEATRDQLVGAYGVLRAVEHRLQMVDDHQTHSLPASPAGVAALATFLGHEDAATFRASLRATLERVEDCYARLFEAVPATAAPSALVFAGTDDDPATVEAIAAMGFSDPRAIIALVRGWLHGRYRATRSERARQLLTRLAPTILSALAGTASPDAAPLRLDSFLQRLPAGIQLFSLFNAHPDLLALVAEILGTSPRLADHLARNPTQLDAVLTPGFFGALPAEEELAAALDQLLASALDYQDVLDLVRRWTNDHRFRAGVRILRQAAGDGQVDLFLSAVAETALRALAAEVKKDFSARHGDFGQPALAIIAMGKLGGREMSIRSDLDLIMVYDVADGTALSTGPRPLPAATYYTRLIQRLLAAITAATTEGPLYEVDMRLRPSGRAGPLATSLEAFSRYQAESAWTWEHMALTRARVISGPPELRRAVEAAIAAVLTRPRDAAALRRDVADMRRRIDREHATDNLWDVKYHRGGLIDIEFIAQYLQLRHAARLPGVLAPRTADALAALAGHGVLDEGAAEELTQALGLWQRAQAFIRLTVDGPFDAEAAPAALRRGLARAARPEDPEPAFAGVEALARALAARAYDQYRRIVEDGAA